MTGDEADFEETGSSEADVALSPNDNADPQVIVDRKVPQTIRNKYEVISYRNAAVILAEARPEEYAEIISALEAFSITTEMIRKAGGNESDMPKAFSKILRPLGWYETVISADLDVSLSWREQIGTNQKGKAVFGPKGRNIRREKYLDGHKIDYVKGKVAFDFEWNSKDQTFDRDLYAMNAFFQSGAIDVGVLVTRSLSLTGEDTVIAYSGSYEQNGDHFTAVVRTRRYCAGQPSVFGIDEVELKLEGRSAGHLVVCKGTAEQAPGLIFEATLIRSRDQTPAKEDNREAPAFHPTKLPKLRGAR